ncbi:hypothetical protein [Sphingobium sp. CFD-2]|uniref:hypothetical protein n=1 Tax=Sphingobium sp. CFD-2 TaxID=2878542 RepID=UPI00214CA848|nr:hypothetical protein [Sphingobium sp. CFD-2]
MQHSSLVEFLSGNISPEALAAEIAAEVTAFRASLKATGNGDIVVSGGPLFLVTKDGARRLLQAVANERLPFDTANYIADCIVMNDDFEFADEATRDAIFFLEDDSGRFVTTDDDWRPTREETLAALALLD